MQGSISAGPMTRIGLTPPNVGIRHQVGARTLKPYSYDRESPPNPAALANTVVGVRRNDRLGPSISEPSPTEIGRVPPDIGKTSATWRYRPSAARGDRQLWDIEIGSLAPPYYDWGKRQLMPTLVHAPTGASFRSKFTETQARPKRTCRCSEFPRFWSEFFGEV
jgi:hypothetical protein